MKALALIFSLFLSHSIHASMDRNCFVTHVKDAIKLNKSRKNLYIARDEKSRGVSNSLILMERMLILPAKMFDLRAKRYQNKGIPILCADLIHIELTPEYTQTTQIPRINYSSVYKPKPSQIKKKIKKAFKEKGFEGLNHEVEFIIKELNKAPEYNCLLRHFLESIHRTGHLAPKYIKEARDLKMKSPKKLLWSYIKLHLFGLSWANKIDIKAGPIQEKGIPILCQDVPAIPLP